MLNLKILAIKTLHPPRSLQEQQGYFGIMFLVKALLRKYVNQNTEKKT